MSSGFVFDASAILAILQGERGSESVAESLYGATISAVNYGEVLKKSAERGGSINHVQAILAQQCLDVVSFDEAHAVHAAEIWAECKPLGLSYADRCCLSLGMMKELPVVTADQQMAETELPVKVQLIRRRKSA